MVPGHCGGRLLYALTLITTVSISGTVLSETAPRAKPDTPTHCRETGGGEGRGDSPEILTSTETTERFQAAVLSTHIGLSRGLEEKSTVNYRDMLELTFYVSL